jgi:hypothetical protein
MVVANKQSEKDKHNTWGKKTQKLHEKKFVNKNSLIFMT